MPLFRVNCQCISTDIWMATNTCAILVTILVTDIITMNISDMKMDMAGTIVDCVIYLTLRLCKTGDAGFVIPEDQINTSPGPFDLSGIPDFTPFGGFRIHPLIIYMYMT